MSKVFLILVITSLTSLCQNIGFDNQYNKLVASLTNDSFQKRKNTQDQILNLSLSHPQTAANKLFFTSKNHKDPEVRARSLDILKDLYLKKFIPPSPGYLGIRHSQIEIQIDNTQKSAALVLSVAPNTPASKAGLLAQDIITKIDDEDLTKVPLVEMRNTISTIIKTKGAGTTINLHIMRGKNKINLKATLALYSDRFDNQDTTEEKFNQWMKELQQTKP